MDYSDQIIKALNDSDKALEAFKANAFARIQSLEDVIAKQTRPGFGIAPSMASGPDEISHKAEFLNYVKTGDAGNLRDLQQKTMAWSTNSGADGGYAVPKVIDAMIASLMVNISPIRSIAQIAQTSSRDYHKLINLRGTASGWVGETAARPATATPTMADVVPPMGELYANFQISQQLVDDVFFNADQFIADQCATEFARAEGAAFIGGVGLAQPAGFLNGTIVSTDDATRPYGQLQYIPTGAAGAFPATNPTDVLINVMFKLKAAHRRNACWVMSKSTLAALTAFKDSAGRYILTPMTSPTVPAALFGFPVVECEDMPAIAANSYSIAFGNFQAGYLIVDRVGTRVLRDPFSAKPNIAFYVTKRLGGSVLDSEAIKLVKFSVS